VIDDDKYVTFKRSDLILVTDGYVTFKTGDELPDAVVIRRQDLIACPALNAYASLIAVAAAVMPDNKQKYELLDIADYFHRQAELAGEEGYRLPSP
jgi:hypothetical protein